MSFMQKWNPTCELAYTEYMRSTFTAQEMTDMLFQLITMCNLIIIITSIAVFLL